MNLLDRVLRDSAPEYRDFLQGLPEEKLVGDVVLLYGLAVLQERNHTYEVQEYLPEWFTLGDDSGGNQLLMRLDGTPAVYSCDAGALGSIEPDLIHPRFAEWLTQGCPRARPAPYGRH